MATNYHIDPDLGSSEGDGTFDDPFESWADLPSMATSDCVYFKCGTTFEPSSYLSVSWSGTSGSPAVIGAYYSDGGSPAAAVYGVSGNRPIIDGDSNQVPGNEYYGPSSSYVGLINVNQQDYVQIKDLHVYESGFYGINFEGDFNDTDCVGLLVENCKIEKAYVTGIRVQKAKYNYGYIQDNEVTECNLGYGYYDERSDWGNCITVNNSPYSYTTIRRNYVYSTYGEGIGVYRPFTNSATDNSGYATIEDNILFDVQKVGIYIGPAQNNIVRRNIVLGAGSVPGYPGTGTLDDRRWNSSGIALWIEGSRVNNTLNNNEVYNNIVTGHYHGIRYGSQYTTGDTLTGNKFYNNTCIGNRYNFWFGTNLSNYTLTDHEFRNNVSLCPSDCTSVDVSGNYSWMSAIGKSTNSWHSQPSNWAGTGDVVSDSNWGKITGWQSITDISALSITDFMPLSNSSVIDAATDLGSPYNMGISIYDTSYNIPISVTTVER